jgi:hypothetical protein
MIELASPHEVALSLQSGWTSLSEDDDAITTRTMGTGVGDWRRVDHGRDPERLDRGARATLRMLGAGPPAGPRTSPRSEDRRRSIGVGRELDVVLVGGEHLS